MPSPYEPRRAELRRNLLGVYSRATVEDTQAGLSWYPRASHGVEVWADTFGLSRAVVANVIAALSPQCRWDANLRIALDVLSGNPVSVGGGGALNANINKAYAVLRDKAESLTPYFKEGHKVKAFALNLQGYADIVTVDTHAGQAACNDVTANPRLGSIAVYSIMADCYRESARIVDTRPCDFQAVVWHVWKREHPPAAKRIHRAQWSVIGEL